MFIVTATIVRRRKRTNSDIQIIDVLSEDDAADCCPGVCSSDEFMDTVFVTVIALGVAEIVTTVLTVSVFVSDSTSVLVVVDVELMSFVFVMTDVVFMVLVTSAVFVSVLVMKVVNVELKSSVLVMTDVMVQIIKQKYYNLAIKN